MVAPMAESVILEGLNPAQYEAVTHVGGPLLVVAGAGSGKTRVLTHRIAHLIEYHGLSPFEILAITFTNKAAGEMRHRVGELVGPVAESMWVSTFHAACVRILRYDAECIDYPKRFTIYDQGDAVRLCGYVLRDLNIDLKKFPPRSVHAAISAAKNDNITAAVYAERASNIFERRIAEAFGLYQRRLQSAGAMDFDDLLQRTVELFRGQPDVLARWRQRFAHVLVDEYQDTNPVQNELVIQLAAESRQVTAVGDADQSIYAFRGADIRNILEFERAFDDVRIVLLEQNYRSTQTILDAANAVIVNNTGRKPKDLWTDRGSGPGIVRYHADDEIDEARYVVSEMVRRHDDEQMRWDEMAVFYRTNAQSRAVEEQLVRAGVPYTLVGGTRFYDRREVRDAMAYLKAVTNPGDEVSVKRALGTPKRGVGAHVGGQARRPRRRAGDHLLRRPALLRRGRRHRPVRRGRRAVHRVDRGRGRPRGSARGRAHRGAGAHGLSGRAEGGEVGRGRRPPGEPGRARGQRPRLRHRRGLPRGGRARGRHRRPGRLRVGGHAHDPALGQGPGVSRRVHDRSGGRRVPPHPVPGRTPRTRGGAPPRLRGHHPGHAPPHPRPRLEPVAVRQPAVQPRRAASSRRSRPSWYRPRTGLGCCAAATAAAATPSAPSIGAPPTATRSWTGPSSRGGARPPSPSGAEGLGLRVGDDVRHAKWGEGVIVDITGSGDDAEASVRFPGEGEKRLLLSWAPLQKI